MKYPIFSGIGEPSFAGLNSVIGNFGGHPVTLFDYNWLSDENVWWWAPSWRRHEYISFIVVKLSKTFPELTLAREGFFLLIVQPRSYSGDRLQTILGGLRNLPGVSGDNYNISVQSGYILVERPQDYQIVPDEQPAMLMRLSVVCKRASCRNVLVLGPDTRVGLSTLDILDLGSLVADSRLKIAVVEAHDASKDDVNFLENVAWNRGGLIQFFDSDTEAKEWLGVA